MVGLQAGGGSGVECNTAQSGRVVSATQRSREAALVIARCACRPWLPRGFRLSAHPAVLLCRYLRRQNRV